MGFCRLGEKAEEFGVVLELSAPFADKGPRRSIWYAGRGEDADAGVEEFLEGVEKRHVRARIFFRYGR